MMDELEKRVDVQENIERFIQGELPAEDVDNLWVKFIESPEWYEYFLTLLTLYSMEK